MKTFIPYLIAALLAFLLGLAVYHSFARPPVQSTVDDSTVLLEQIRKVSKLVTIEGDVSEMFNRTSTRHVTMYLPLPTRFEFEKEALVQVTGKVLVGYDLQKIAITVDSTSRTIYLSNLPEPEILAIDHEIVYKDLDESWFNSFTAKDYSDLNKAAKESLRRRALESELLEAARVEGNSVIETIRFLGESAGFSVVVSSSSSRKEDLRRE